MRPLTFDQRDHYGRILWNAYRDNCDLLGDMGNWDDQPNGTQTDFRNMAETVVWAVLAPNQSQPTP